MSLPLPGGLGGIVGIGGERPLPLLLLAGWGGELGQELGMGGERPLPLPLHVDRPPTLGSPVPNRVLTLPYGA